MIPPLESETRTAGTGEIHQQVPQQLPLRGVAPEGPPQGQPDLIPISEPLGARVLKDSKPQNHQPPSTAPLSSPSNVSNMGIVAAPTARTMHSSQLKSPPPQYTPTESLPRLPHSHPQGSHPPGQARPSLNQTGQTRQSHSTYAAATPGAFSSGDSYQLSSQKDDFSYNPKNYQSQQATYPPYGTIYQPNDTSGQPPQAYQPHHMHGSQPQSQEQPPQLSTSETAPTEPGPIKPVVKALQSDTNTTAYHAEDDNDDSENDQDLQFENPLQRQVDDDIHREASKVRQEVSGGRRHIKTDHQRPFDPNLVCPMCRKQFRIGEIQKFKHHVNTCDGTEDIIT